MSRPPGERSLPDIMKKRGRLPFLVGRPLLLKPDEIHLFIGGRKESLSWLISGEHCLVAQVGRALEKDIIGRPLLKDCLYPFVYAVPIFFEALSDIGKMQSAIEIKRVIYLVCVIRPVRNDGVIFHRQLFQLSI